MNGTVRVFCFLLALPVVAFSQTGSGHSSQSQFRTLTVDAGTVKGTIRSFQGVNGPPYPIREGLPNLVKQYRDLHIDSVRTHDSYGPTEIDAVYTDKGIKMLFQDDAVRRQVSQASQQNSIFRDWNADPTKPESYNFGPSDKLVQAIRESGAEVYYRVGRSAGGNLEPPKNFDKYATIVAHIAMHYNQGWAHGFHDQIRYWEIWNEPEFFWSGTPAQFYQMYAKVSLALKAVDPALKIGTDANAAPLNDGPYREDLFDYIRAHKLPFDFYSWHTYADMSYDPYDAVRIGQDTRRALDAKGFNKVESILSEWNLSADFTKDEEPELSSMSNAAFVGAVLVYLQDSAVDFAHFYRADPLWMGLFNTDGTYRKPAYAFRATGLMLNTPQRLSASGADTYGFAMLAGRSADNKKVQILIDNYQIPPDRTPPVFRMMQKFKEQGIMMEMPTTFDLSKLKSLPKRTGIQYHDNQGYNLKVTNLPWGNKPFSVKRYRLTEADDFTMVEQKKSAGASISLSNPLPPPGLELIVLQVQ
jgi:xylan 1,4-beta-xylosidase